MFSSSPLTPHRTLSAKRVSPAHSTRVMTTARGRCGQVSWSDQGAGSATFRPHPRAVAWVRARERHAWSRHVIWSDHRVDAFGRLEPVVAEGLHDRFEARVHAELAEEASDVVAGRLFGDLHPGGDLGRREAL